MNMRKMQNTEFTFIWCVGCNHSYVQSGAHHFGRLTPLTPAGDGMELARSAYELHCPSAWCEGYATQ